MLGLLIFNLNKNLHKQYKKYFLRYSIFGNLLHEQRSSLGLTKKYKHYSNCVFYFYKYVLDIFDSYNSALKKYKYKFIFANYIQNKKYNIIYFVIII